MKNTVIDNFYEVELDALTTMLRDDYSVIVYNSCAPFVDPTHNNDICYGYTAKYCNARDGWNGRIQITEPVFSHNVVEAKREVLKRCIKWILER